MIPPDDDNISPAGTLAKMYGYTVKGPDDLGRARSRFECALRRLNPQTIIQALHDPSMQGRYAWEVVKLADSLELKSISRANLKKEHDQKQKEYSLRLGALRRAKEAQANFSFKDVVKKLGDKIKPDIANIYLGKGKNQ